MRAKVQDEPTDEPLEKYRKAWKKWARANLVPRSITATMASTRAGIAAPVERPASGRYLSDEGDDSRTSLPVHQRHAQQLVDAFGTGRRPLQNAGDSPLLVSEGTVAELAGELDVALLGDQALELVRAEHADDAGETLGRTAAIVRDGLRGEQTNRVTRDQPRVVALF